MNDPAAPQSVDAVDLASPVILLGRGGSGTRLISDLAARLGVFLGEEVNVSGDSVEWVEVLYPLAIEAAAHGIAPGSARDLYWIERLRDKARTFAAPSAGRPWGWKLPETMLAIGPVLRAFPGARVVHLVRHPVTSALRRTHVTSRADNPVGEAVLSAAYRASGWDSARIASDEPYLHNAASWRFQIETVIAALAAMQTANLQVCYEDLCAEPSQTRLGVARFLGLPQVGGDEPEVDWARTNQADDADPKAAEVWSLCRAPATALGYTWP